MRRIGLMSVMASCVLMVLLQGCQSKTEQGDSGVGKPDEMKGPVSEYPIQAGKYTILDTRTDMADRVRAKQNVEDTLIKYPEVGCLVGLWSYNPPAILSAVKDAKKEGKVKIVAFDEEEETLQGIADGYIHGTIAQQPFEFGYQSVKILSALARGDRSVVPASGVVEIPVRVVRKADVEAFRSYLKELMASANAPQNNASGGNVVEIALVSNTVSDFWRYVRAGVLKGEKEFNARCEFRMPADGTPAEQQRIVEDMIAKKVSGMAISPIDPQNQQELINKACGVMNVICQDSDAPDTKRLCYVGTNNYQAGREAGKLIKEAMPDGGQVVIFVGRLDAQNARERRQGVIDELMGKPMQE